MTTITFEENIKVVNSTYEKAIDFLSFFDTDTLYEEYLERKMQEVKNASSSDFINL
ncbi:MAG: hypothetical protein Q9M94_06210 [Candidatus Gracilibacteria bacterium]|nr:hypothetical protein [Candidatus Gracilibacteria bacterium]MDQ7022763.1 hypothetical protein [Candidatus Gracilibacteria bacterium]